MLIKIMRKAKNMIADNCCYIDLCSNCHFHIPCMAITLYVDATKEMFEIDER